MSLHFQLNPDLYRHRDGRVSLHVTPVKRVVALDSVSCSAVKSPLRGLRRPPPDATRLTVDKWHLSVDDGESPLVDASRAYTSAYPEFRKLQLLAQETAQRLLATDSMGEISADNQRQVLSRIIGWHNETSRKITETILAWVQRTKAHENETYFEVDAGVVRSLSLRFPLLASAAQDISEELNRRKARWDASEGEGLISMLEVRRFYDRLKDESKISRTLDERRNDLLLRRAQEVAVDRRYRSYVEAKSDRSFLDRMKGEDFDHLQQTAAALWEVDDRQDDPDFVSALTTLLGGDTELDADKLFTFLEADNKRYCSWLVEKLGLADTEIGGAAGDTTTDKRASKEPYYTHPTSIKKVRSPRCFFKSLSTGEAELCRMASETDQSDMTEQTWIETTVKVRIGSRSKSSLPRGTYTKAGGTVIGSGVTDADAEPSEADTATIHSGVELSMAGETEASTPVISLDGDILSTSEGSETSDTDQGLISPPSDVWNTSTVSVRPLQDIQRVQESLSRAMRYADRRKQDSRGSYGPSLYSYLPTEAKRSVQEADLRHNAANESLADRLERLEGLTRRRSVSDVTGLSIHGVLARRNSLA